MNCALAKPEEARMLRNFRRIVGRGCFFHSLVSIAILAILTLSAPATAASLQARVDLSRQRMEVYIDGNKRHDWAVSTGRDGWRTPPGKYYPFALTRHYYSSQWRMNLPYLISISRDGIAIHGTELSSSLGRPASHGCIRLSIPNAARLYALVQKYGMASTEVVVVR
jgi:lipoprotein-anchoring transpeptidase ErfK/SrfK